LRDRPFRRSRARRGDHQAPRAATPSPYGLPSQAATLGCERAGCAARRLTLERARCGREFPGELERIRVWFQDYKIPDGKPANKFGFDNQPQNKEFTLKARVPAQPYPVKVHGAATPAREPRARHIRSVGHALCCMLSAAACLGAACTG